MCGGGSRPENVTPVVVASLVIEMEVVCLGAGEVELVVVEPRREQGVLGDAGGAGLLGCGRLEVDEATIRGRLACPFDLDVEGRFVRQSCGVATTPDGQSPPGGRRSCRVL